MESAGFRLALRLFELMQLAVCTTTQRWGQFNSRHQSPRFLLTQESYLTRGFWGIGMIATPKARFLFATWLVTRKAETTSLEPPLAVALMLFRSRTNYPGYMYS